MRADDLGDTERAKARRQAEAEALEILHDLRDWRLTPSRWDLVGQIIASMTAAAAEGDVAALQRATTDLELVSPVRIIKIGETPQGPPPDPVREQANRLIHSLGGPANDAAAQT
jgi:hypothetical protein